jgi:hypothetical protein
MAQKTINVGTVANDGTGDTIRGAFTNVNANFTEVYSNISNLSVIIAGIDLEQNTTIQASFNVANAAFAFSNSVNTLAYNIGTSSNLFSISVGSAGNAYTVSVGASDNAYTQSVGTAGNNYASILAANNAVGANAWTNTVSVTTYSWANSTFTTLSNTAVVFNTTNSAFDKANTSFQNTSGTLGGNVIITGTLSTLGGYFDAIGSVREKFFVYVNSNGPILASQSVVIANNSNNITIRIPDDNVFLAPANIGTTIEVYQYGAGTTKIIANDAAVTVNSSNNWANLAGQYLTATAVKVLANTWILTGDLKA